MSWEAKFSEPVPLPDGGELKTLHDARAFVLKLPKAAAAETAWQTATETLLLAAEHGTVDFARIRLMQALYPTGDPVCDTSRKDPKWGKKYKLLRDR